MKTLLISIALLLAGRASCQQTVYELWFTVDQVQHHGLLLSGNGPADWLLRIKYLDPANGAVRMIEQPMHAETTALGICLRGQHVWDVLRRRPAADYATDNFYFYLGKDHLLHPQNLDAQGGTGALTMVALHDPKTCDSRLKEFGWSAACHLAPGAKQPALAP